MKNTIQRVWIHDTKDEGRNPDENVMVGHTKSYVKVLIKRDPELVGKRAIVKITDVHKWHVYGEIIEKNPKPIHVNFDDHFKGMYYNQKKESANSILNEIKREQEDIHATIKLSYDRVEKKNVLINNSNEDNKTAAKVIVGDCKTSENQKHKLDLSSFLFVISLIFLYLGIDKMIKI